MGTTSIPIPASASKSNRDRTIGLHPYLASALAVARAAADADPLYVLRSPQVGRGGPGAKLRAATIFRRLDAWLRGQGWTARHTLHEFRALYGRRMREEHGLGVAQSALGHADERTTQDHYTGTMDAADKYISERRERAAADARINQKP